MGLAEHADASYERWGDRRILHFEGTWWTSRQLRDRTARFAGGLRDRLGLRPGERVVVLLPNVPEVGIAYAGTWRAGGVVTPVVFLIQGAELQHVLSDSGARIVVTSPEFLATVLAATGGTDVQQVVVVGDLPVGLPPQPGAGGPQLVSAAELEQAEPLEAPVGRADDDLAALLYTGGTTGRAKGVMLSHAGLTAVGRGGAEATYVEGMNRTLLPLPLSHAYGLLVSVIGLFVREPSESVLMRWFDPAGFLRLAVEHQVQRTALVPSMIAMLLTQPLEEHDLSQLRFVGSGGAPLAPELALEFQRRVPSATVSEGYGMTETSALCTVTPPLAVRLGSVGVPAPGYEVRICDPLTGAEVPTGSEGEVCVRGPGLMIGYWHDEEATAATIRDGWLHTGDVGVLDDEGYLRIVDRLKDLVIRGGFNVYPRDVEDGLLGHPEVVLAGVVGRPDPTYGEEVVAFVSLRPGATVTGEDLVTWSRAHMAKTKYPREVHVLDTVPLTPVGKLDRKALRTRVRTPA
jgi:long-chain acyl-CoA synthetase